MLLTKIRRWLEYFGLMLFTFPCYYLPRKFALSLGKALGWFMAHFIPIRRSVVESNIARAFPQKSIQEIKRITIETYEHFGTLAAEFVRQDKYDETAISNLVTIENRELLDEAYEQGNGIIMLLGHFGNWEFFGRWLGMMEYPIVAIQKTQENPIADTFIQTKRITKKTITISKSAPVSKFISALQNGRLLYILADQDAKSDGIFVDFFGIPSSTARGAAVFARKLNSPIILAFPIKLPNNCYRVVLEKLPFTSLGTSHAIHHILQQYMNRLEYYVRKYPEQYFWFHRRWKTKPEKQESGENIVPSLAGAAG